MPRGLPLLPGRHALHGAGRQRPADRRGVLPGSVHGAGPGQHGGGVPLQEEQGEGGGNHPSLLRLEPTGILLNFAVSRRTLWEAEQLAASVSVSLEMTIENK